MRKAVTAAQGLDEWIAGASCRRGTDAAWKRWPPALIEEMREVLRRNDAGTARVSADAMMRRAKDAHGVQISKNQITLTARQCFGRTSWATK